MRFLRSWRESLYLKMISILALLFAMLLGSLGMAASGLHRTDGQFRGFIQGEVQLFSDTKDLYKLGLESNEYIRNYILWSYDKQSMQEFNDSVTQINQKLIILKPLAEKYGFTTQYNDIVQLFQRDQKIQQLAEATVQRSKQEFSTDAISDMEDETAVWRVLGRQLIQMETTEQQLFDRKARAIHRTISRQILTMGLVLILFFLCCAGLLWIMRRNILQPIRRLKDQVNWIAGGDLRIQAILINSSDEIGKFAFDVNKMAGSLRDLIQRIQHASDEVAQASAYLKHGTDEMSHSSTVMLDYLETVSTSNRRQYDGIQATGITMAEIASGIERITHSTEEVSKLSHHTAAQAEQGNLLIRTMLAHMDEIETSSNESANLIQSFGSHSKEIQGIARSIAHIAQQIKMLSLNASIEAARAGEHGRGFAVVSGEVRKLAMETDEFSNEIDRIVQVILRDTERLVETVSKNAHNVEDGSTSVRHSGKAFQEILSSAQYLSRQINEVFATVEEIAAGSEDIRTSIAEISELATDSLVKVEETNKYIQNQVGSIQEIAGSSQALNEVALELNAMMGSFKLERQLQEDE